MNLSKIESLVIEGDLSRDALIYLIGCRGECAWLDFKESLHLEHDSPLCDFARDILAMKNVGGGFLVIGVKDKTWAPKGLDSELSYDSKLLRDQVRRATGTELEVHIVHHRIYVEGANRLFAIIYVRGSKKRRKRRMPTLVGKDFCGNQSYGLRRGEIYFRNGDSTVRLDNGIQLEELLDELESQADEEAATTGGNSPFVIEDGTYRLLEKGFDRFVGREVLRNDVLSALSRDPRIWIVNVHGPGGVGKSAVVNWVTYECYNHRKFDAILQLSGKETILTPSGIRRYGRSLYSLDDLLEQIIEMFEDQAPADLESKQIRALEILSLWNTLLVLDNMETVTDGRVLSFVQNLPPESKCKVLMTSRTKTGGWELSIPVAELSLPEVEEFLRIKTDELQAGFPTDKKTAERVLAISGGLPLAIQWMIGRYNVTGDLTKILDDARSPDSPVLEFSFRNIWSRASAEAKSVLAVMTIFDSPPTLQQLVVATEWNVDRIDKAIGELAEFTLVNRVSRQPDGVTVYTALPITLTFAQHQFHTMGDFEVRCRQRVQRFEEQWSLQQSEVRHFASTFDRHGLTTDAEKRAAILCTRGQSEMFGGNTDNADALFKQARDLAPTCSYVFAMSGSYELARNRIGVAMEFAKTACKLATKKTGALAYTILARIHDVQRNKRERVDALQKAVEFDSTDSIVRHQYGVALSRAGDTQKAIDQFTEIIRQERTKVPLRETLMMALKTRVINYRRIGSFAEADSDMSEAENILKENPHLQAQARHFIDLREEIEE